MVGTIAFIIMCIILFLVSFGVGIAAIYVIAGLLHLVASISGE